jgi:CheY-like chemotaxis protein
LFGQLLNEAGYSYYEASNGVEAKELILRVHFDLIIVDLAMPEMDGFEVLQFARFELPDLKIIVASGFTGHDAESGEAIRSRCCFGQASRKCVVSVNRR